MDARKKLSVDEAADYLGIARRTLYNWSSARKVPHIKAGSRLLFDQAELESWLEARAVPAIGA